MYYHTDLFSSFTNHVQWSLLIGSAGQAFAMFYIGINQAVHPPTGTLDGNAIFAIVCVYLFVVFYSFGWGPIPFVLSSECAPNHVRSLIMALALMTQWVSHASPAIKSLSNKR